MLRLTPVPAEDDAPNPGPCLDSGKSSVDNSGVNSGSHCPLRVDHSTVPGSAGGDGQLSLWKSSRRRVFEVFRRCHPDEVLELTSTVSELVLIELELDSVPEMITALVTGVSVLLTTLELLILIFL